MLELKELQLRDAGRVHISYNLRHNVGHLRTTVENTLNLEMDSRTGAVKATLVFDPLEAKSLEEAKERLAVWCDRMAAALRAPMAVATAIPVFEYASFDRARLTPAQREQFERLVAEMANSPDEDAMAGDSAEIAAAHPISLIRGALDQAIHEAALRLNKSTA